MRRPILFLLIPLLIGHIAFLNLAWAISLLVVYIFTLVIGPNWLPRNLLLIIGLLSGFMLTKYYYVNHIHLIESTPQLNTISGTFYEESPLDSSKGTLRITSDDAHLNGKYIRLYFQANQSIPKSGSLIRVTGKFQVPQYARNRYRFNEQLYLASKSIVGTYYVSSVKTQSIGSPLEAFRSQMLGASVKKLLNQTAFNEGAVAVGMLLGTDELIEEKTEAAFKKTGIMHLLSISGAHFAVLFYYLNLVTNRLKLSYGLRKALHYGIMCTFVWLIGAPVSALRALLMFFILEVMRIGRRQPDGLSALAICLSILFLLNPFVIWDIGLQLASLAMFALICFVPMTHELLGVNQMKRKLLGEKGIDSFYQLKRLGLKLLEEVYSGFAISIVMTPLLAYYFYQVQWVGIILGPLLTLLATAYLPIGALQLLNPVSFINTLLGTVSGGLLTLTNWLADTLASKIQMGLMSSGGSFSIGLLLISMMLILLSKDRLLFSHEQKKHTVCLSVCLGLLILAVELPQFISPVVLKSIISQEPQIIGFDVGQGDSTLLITASGQTILIDTGLEKGKLQVYESLLSIGVKRIDFLILSHPHDDHYGGIEQIISHIKVKEFIYYEGQYTSSAQKSLDRIVSLMTAANVKTTPFFQGQTLQLNSGDYLKCLWPPKVTPTTDENDQSLVFEAMLDSVNLLLTGDISKDVEYDIINHVQQGATILKLAHHGSKYSNSEPLLNLPQLRFAYGQAGLNNRYKHPHPDTLERLQTAELPYMTTNQSGAIWIRVSKKSISIQNEKIRNQGHWR